MNMKSDETANMVKMAMKNENWTILNGNNGDISGAAEAIVRAKENGAKIENVVMHHHGAVGRLSIGNWILGDHSGEETMKIFYDDVDRFAANGTTSKGKFANEINSYLQGVYKIAGALSSGGNFIFTACEAGATYNYSENLAMSLYKLFRCVNPLINVLLNVDESMHNNPQSNYNKDITFLFNKPISRNSGALGWVVANQKSTRTMHAVGDIQINTSGKPITFSAAIYRLLNR